MRIDPVVLRTADLERCRRFDFDLLSARTGAGCGYPSQGFASGFHGFADGARFEAMCHVTDPAGNRSRRAMHGADRSGHRHRARGPLDRLRQRPKDESHSALYGPRRTADGWGESGVLDLDGSRIATTV